MAVKGSEIRSGLFVIIALVVLTILIFAVGNLRQRFRTTNLYHVFLTDVKFLRPHDAVTFGGIRVGEVNELRVSKDRFGQVRVTFEVDQNVEVREDSILILKQDGMLGPKYLEVMPGSPAAPLAKPGTELKGKVLPAITDLTTEIQEPLARLNRVLGHLEAILGGPENQKNIAAILEESKTLLGSLEKQVGEVGTSLKKMTSQTQDVLTEVHQTVKEARGPLASTLKNADALTAGLVRKVDELSGRLNTTADHLDRLLQDADGLIVQNNKNIFETIRAMRDTAYHMEQAAKRIRANPAILVFGAEETEEERLRTDETELRLKGRARRYDKEEPR